MPSSPSAAPPDILYRIGKDNPLAFPPWDRVGDGRFDDPARARYRLLYAGERRACFFESLARFRPPPRLLLNRESLPPEIVESIGRIPPRWLRERQIASFLLVDMDPPSTWLDLRRPESHQLLRYELAALLVGLDVQDFDISIATSSERRLTQPIGNWAFEQGYQGIIYCTRFDPRLACYAIVERDNGVRIAELDRQRLS
jgi:hypothetical protein